MKKTNLNSVQIAVNRNRTKRAILYSRILGLSNAYSKTQMDSIKKIIRSAYTDGYCDGAISQITK